ncbi:hypothetical protein PR048_005321 [Dryococelus australis]|uniref:Uncharacterized protein n=1 Tax=Dryococelus australis TaxID=614101 RepID=A0ABQ9I7T1_9NEOP|nr:hypothetical protein PR048_005321 [Dryococelus australis]
MYDILGIKTLLGSSICINILFLHAFTGSDTTSRIFGIGKATTLEKLMKDKQLQAAANIFSSDGSQQIDIKSAGQKVMSSNYPTVSDMPPVQEWLLKMIDCSCKTKCVTMCSGCKQNGLPCSASCGVCQISGCDNIVVIDNNDCDSDA